MDCPESGCSCCCECGRCRNAEGSHMGTTEMTQWEQDAALKDTIVAARKEKRNYEKVWPQLEKVSVKFDPVQSAANFYLLESIVNDVPFTQRRQKPIEQFRPVNPERDSHFGEVLQLADAELERWVKIRNRVLKPSTIQKLVDEARSLFVDVVDEADSFLVPYFHMAIGGELRHHRAVGARILSMNRSLAWSGWRTLIDVVGADALLHAAELFREITGGTYGGDAWAVPCEVLHARVTDKYGADFAARQIFVDRAWTLEHNGGCFLNKISWHVAPGNEVGSIDHMKRLLNAQAADPTEYDILVAAAAPKVKVLFKDYWSDSVQTIGLSDVEQEPDFMKPRPPRVLCAWCQSNPHVGHRSTCGFVLHYADTENQDDFHTKVPSFNIDNYDWSHWVEDDTPFEDTGYAWRPDGTYKIAHSLLDRFTVRLRWNAYSSNVGGTVSKESKWVGTFQEFLDGKANILNPAEASAEAGMPPLDENGTAIMVRIRIAGSPFPSEGDGEWQSVGHWWNWGDNQNSLNLADHHALSAYIALIKKSATNDEPVATVSEGEGGWTWAALPAEY